jgi:hypothetical protein
VLTLHGPNMRIRELETEPVPLAEGRPFTLITDQIVGHETRASEAGAPRPQPGRSLRGARYSGAAGRRLGRQGARVLLGREPGVEVR